MSDLSGPGRFTLSLWRPSFFFASIVAPLAHPTHPHVLSSLFASGPYTLFAPVNVAFANSRVNVTRLLLPMWTAHLRDLLQYQAALQEIWASDLEVGDQIVSTNGEVIDVTSANPNPLVLNYNATIFEEGPLFFFLANSRAICIRIF